MQKAHVLVIVVALLIVAGCSAEPRIDASSDEKLTESITEVKNSLSLDEQEEFEEAIMVVAFGQVDNIFEMLGKADSFEAEAKKALDNKTAREVIKEAELITLRRRAEQKKQIIQEIAELEEKKQSTEVAAEALGQFVVKRSRFYFSESSFMDEPVVELTVQNNTSHAVARAHFHGVLATPGRSVPWVEDDFNYQISGGLEPGESATWNLAPNMFSDWGKAPKERKDMVLTVTTVRIDGADGEPIYDAEYSRFDQERLN